MPLSCAGTWDAGSLALDGIVSGGQTLIDVSTGTATISVIIADGAGGALTINGTGTLVLNGNNTYTGDVSTLAGTSVYSGANTYTGYYDNQ